MCRDTKIAVAMCVLFLEKVFLMIISHGFRLYWLFRASPRS